MGQLGEHALVLGQLRLQLLEEFYVGGLEGSVPGLPLVVRRRTDAVLGAHVFDGNTGLGFVQDGNNLVLGDGGCGRSQKFGLGGQENLSRPFAQPQHKGMSELPVYKYDI